MKGKSLFLLFVCLSALGWMGCQTNPFQPQTLVTDQEEFTKQVPVADNIRTVEVHHDHGSVMVQGWDKPYILLEGYKSVTGADVDKVRQWLAQMQIIAYERAPNRLVIEYQSPMTLANQINPFDPTDETVHFTMSVPRELQVEVYNKNGAVKVTDIVNSVLIDHSVGDIDAQNIEGGLSIIAQTSNMTISNIGHFLDIDSKNGSIGINWIAGGAVVRHKTGDVKIADVGGDLSISGDKVEWTVNRVNGQLDVQVENGNAIVNNFGGGATASMKNGSLNLQPQRAISADFACEAINGDLTLQVPETSSMLMTLTAEPGSIQSDFPLPISSARGQSQARGAVNNGEHAVDMTVKGGKIQVIKIAGDASAPLPPVVYRKTNEPAPAPAAPIQEAPVNLGPATQPGLRSPDLQPTELK
ncbi:MAG: hypothetical protein GC154_05985 [bacterium]|nr:hypothetical protein [bacterium]